MSFTLQTQCDCCNRNKAAIKDGFFENPLIHGLDLYRYDVLDDSEDKKSDERRKKMIALSVIVCTFVLLHNTYNSCTTNHLIQGLAELIVTMKITLTC